MNELRQRYKKVRDASVAMCKPLETEDYIPQPVPFVSPPKWNLGHTSWFFEHFILEPFFADYKVFHPVYGFLFNSYYQSAGNRLLRSERGSLSRPTVKEVYEYRAHVDSAMQHLLRIETVNPELLDLFEIGLNHEQQHQELFYADLKYTFSTNPLLPSYGSKIYVEDMEIYKQEWAKVNAGLYTIGHEGKGFCYDNELGRHKVYLHAFEISKALVTNEEFIAFIADGGYQNFEFWHSEGWAWVKENNAKHPMYWILEKDTWYQYTLAGLRRINPLNPITHVNYYEAAAFAAWKGMRLPTEFEWEAACGFFEYGNRWEWTESAYLPYPGYKKPKGAVGEYNGKFMVNQKVLRGGSVVSPPGHVRKSYRNFFHPNEGWQFNGIRLAK